MWARVAKRFVASGGVGGGWTGTEVSSSSIAAGVRGFAQAGAWRAVSSVSAAHRAAGESRRRGVAVPVLSFLPQSKPYFFRCNCGEGASAWIKEHPRGRSDGGGGRGLPLPRRKGHLRRGGAVPAAFACQAPRGRVSPNPGTVGWRSNSQGLLGARHPGRKGEGRDRLLHGRDLPACTAPNDPARGKREGRAQRRDGAGSVLQTCACIATLDNPIGIETVAAPPWLTPVASFLLSPDRVGWRRRRVVVMAESAGCGEGGGRRHQAGPGAAVPEQRAVFKGGEQPAEAPAGAHRVQPPLCGLRLHRGGAAYSLPEWLLIVHRCTGTHSRILLHGVATNSLDSQRTGVPVHTRRILLSGLATRSRFSSA